MLAGPVTGGVPVGAPLFIAHKCGHVRLSFDYLLKFDV